MGGSEEVKCRTEGELKAGSRSSSHQLNGYDLSLGPSVCPPPPPLPGGAAAGPGFPCDLRCHLPHIGATPRSLIL